MAGGVGFSNVANFAYTYPGSASGVVANVKNGYGNDVGDGSVIVLGDGVLTTEFIAMENSGYMLQETGSKIQLEA